ncbi:MAG: cell division protein ZapA [Candidatus Fimivivens sp.]
MMNRIKIKVLEATYTIASPESEEYVQTLAAELDAQARALMEVDAKLSPNAALILCAMGYADAFHKSEKSADHMRSQLTDYLEDASKARTELDEARREIEKLRLKLSAAEK